MIRYVIALVCVCDLLFTPAFVYAKHRLHTGVHHGKTQRIRIIPPKHVPDLSSSRAELKDPEWGVEYVYFDYPCITGTSVLNLARTLWEYDRSWTCPDPMAEVIIRIAIPQSP